MLQNICDWNVEPTPATHYRIFTIYLNYTLYCIARFYTYCVIYSLVYSVGSENIKVVIADVEDINSERKITEWWMVGDYRDWELLTLSKTEMRSLIKHKINPLSAERRMANKLRHFYQILQEAAGNGDIPLFYSSIVLLLIRWVCFFMSITTIAGLGVVLLSDFAL